MAKWLPHIGLRTIKTAIAVALALLIADLRGSPAAIFAAIGAIVAMNRTLGDAVQSCLTQFFGILLGAGFGSIMVLVFNNFRYPGIAIGIIGLILLCVKLKLQFAVPLACIVFVSICLSPAEEALFYGLNRLIDTSIGLGVALIINIILKPYKNHKKIRNLFLHYLQVLPGYINTRVIEGQYPDLTPLYQQISQISEELLVFEKQNLFRMEDHAEQAVFFRGCEQLAQSLLQELVALCGMGEEINLYEKNTKRFHIIGLAEVQGIKKESQKEEDIVSNYHLSNFLDAYTFLSDFILME